MKWTGHRWGAFAQLARRNDAWTCDELPGVIVRHCGHQTALRPYYIDGRFNELGCFHSLKLAQAAAEQIGQGEESGMIDMGALPKLPVNADQENFIKLVEARFASAMAQALDGGFIIDGDGKTAKVRIFWDTEIAGIKRHMTFDVALSNIEEAA